MIALLATTALGQAPSQSSPSDLSVTSVGADALAAPSIGETDVNLLLAQRLRWTFAKDTRALVDGRFAVDPGAAVVWEDSRVRELGVAYGSPRLLVLAGRNPLVNGGPRLVDGAQGVANVGPQGQFQLGAWAGAVPSEFTTAPTSRFGFGPILAWTRTETSLSATGDFVFGALGNRLGTLFLGRAELGSKVETTGRLDWLFSDSAGNHGLVDGSLWLQYRPVKPTRVDLFWNGYSSLLYQTTSTIDPTVQRFATRIEELGLAEGITQDRVDPTLHHQLGATFSTRGTGTVAPIAALRARTLLYPDPAERYDRFGGMAGVGGLAGERLELAVDGNLMLVDAGTGGDAGVLVTFEPDPHGALAFDGSFRVLVDPAEFVGYPGWYADLYVDVVSRGGTALSAGGAWSDEPSDLLGQDVGIQGFVRLQQWVRPNRGSSAPSSPVGTGSKAQDSTLDDESDDEKSASNED